jgi:hypothetical protein
MALKFTALMALVVISYGWQAEAGSTYPDLMDQAIYNTYRGGGYFYQASCSICHGNKPESASNANTDFASNFKMIGRNLLPSRTNLSNLTLTEMTIIVRGMSGYDPDSDGWTNEQEWGWDQETQQFINPSNPNDYFSNPTNAPIPGGPGVSQQSGVTTEATGPRMGGCAVAADGSQDQASAFSWLILGFPLSLLFWKRAGRRDS